MAFETKHATPIILFIIAVVSIAGMYKIVGSSGDDLTSGSSGITGAASLPSSLTIKTSMKGQGFQAIPTCTGCTGDIYLKKVGSRSECPKDFEQYTESHKGIDWTLNPSSSDFNLDVIPGSKYCAVAHDSSGGLVFASFCAGSIYNPFDCTAKQVGLHGDAD